jgi:hypothetical protein
VLKGVCMTKTAAFAMSLATPCPCVAHEGARF